MVETLRPQSEDELADIVRGADGATFEIVGRSTKRAFGRPVETSAVLELSRLSGIVSYEPDELVITARAATPVSEIDAAIGEKSQRLGFDPADWGPFYGASKGTATIGGVLSADASGPARLRFGAARDHLLGFRAVNGLGEIYKAGGHVVKNVTGFDVPKLMCGAMGTLGPLSEVTLRLVPRTETSVTLVARDVDSETGLALLRRAWSSPLEPSGLAYAPKNAALAGLGEIGSGGAIFRLDGAAGPLADKIEALRRILGEQDLATIDDGDALFSRIGSGSSFVGRTDDVWRVFVPPARAAACVAELASPFWLADWAGGVIWAEGGEPEHIHSIAAWAGGYATLMRASEQVRRDNRVFSPQTHTRTGLTKRVKAAFDPRGLFNPGRMYEGI